MGGEVSFTNKKQSALFGGQILAASIVRDTDQKSGDQGWEKGSGGVLGHRSHARCTVPRAGSNLTGPVLFALEIQRELAAAPMEGCRAFLGLSHG